MAKKPTAAPATVVTAPATTEVFVIKTHSKRSEIQGAGRNLTQKFRGVTVYIGRTPTGMMGNSCTQIDYILKSKQDQYRKNCSEQPSHSWMKQVAKGDDAFIIFGCDANGFPLYPVDEAPAARRLFQTEVARLGLPVTFTGKLTKDEAVLPAGAAEHVKQAIEQLKVWLAGAAEKSSDEVENTSNEDIDNDQFIGSSKDELSNALEFHKEFI